MKNCRYSSDSFPMTDFFSFLQTALDLLQDSVRGSCGITHLQREGQYLYTNKGFITPE